MRTAVFANGNYIDSPLARAARAICSLIIAADGGARHCRTLGITPQIIIGDMDSIEPDLLTQYEKGGVEIVRYPKDKNESDLELALDYARECGATDISIFGGFGDRWDFSTANLILLAQPRFSTFTLRCIHGMTETSLVRAGLPRRIAGNPGDTVSFLPLTADAQGVTLTGFRYPLQNETLAAGATRGLSNKLIAEAGTISISRGSLLCFHTR